MNEEKKDLPGMDPEQEKDLEKVTGGLEGIEEYMEVQAFREAFIKANCSHCAKRGTDDCTFPNDNYADAKGMYYMFRNRPGGCPFIIPK